MIFVEPLQKKLGTNGHPIAEVTNPPPKELGYVHFASPADHRIQFLQGDHTPVLIRLTLRGCTLSKEAQTVSSHRLSKAACTINKPVAIHGGCPTTHRSRIAAETVIRRVIDLLRTHRIEIDVSGHSRHRMQRRLHNKALKALHP
ncbi:MAG: hypothetical protein BWY82_02898 [Verrucomicrobia bacterium ADurb.Bin474]|nr:MAG: hypothetical protein BWY82_02898 [Verrucomicrobia bacterium ADurb.Bin474]